MIEPSITFMLRNISVLPALPTYVVSSRMYVLTVPKGYIVF